MSEEPLTQAMQSESPILARALRIGIRSVVEPPATSLDGLLKQLALLVLQASGQPDEDTRRTLRCVLESTDPDQAELRELLLHLLSSGALSEPPTVLALYEVDRFVASPFQDDVFNMLRTWQEDSFFKSLRLFITTRFPSRFFPVVSQSSLWTKVIHAVMM